MASSSSDPARPFPSPPPVPVSVSFPVPVQPHPPRKSFISSTFRHIHDIAANYGQIRLQLRLRSSIAPPEYKTVNEGLPHAPKFRSTVYVGGMSYTSQSTFPQRKASEQDASRLALESLLQRGTDEGPSLVSEACCNKVVGVNSSRYNIGLMYKNRLLEFVQRSSIALPEYRTVNEGLVHAPKFRSTVCVGGMSYTSQSTFRNRKASEQDAARLALESLLQRGRDEGPSLVSEISILCKSIMNEYAAKLHVERPTYNTVQQQLGGVLPVFITYLVFNGTSYTGDAARTKKDAEQSAAHAAILSIMGDSSSGSQLIEMIKSKSNFYDAIKGKGLSLLQASKVLPTANAGPISVTLDHNDTEVAGTVADNNIETKVEFPESSKMLSTCQEFQTPKQESSPEATKVSLQPGSADSIEDGGSSSKKRRKNKKKGNKKSRLESPLPIAAVPMNQVPPCSVAQ
ncbi:Double-stranded RNA-binding protein 4, partial [Mucuna pruriens]